MGIPRSERLVRITEYLRAQDEPVTVAALAQRFSVARRTLFRDLAVLREDGVSIIGSPAPGGGLSLDATLPEATTKPRSNLDLPGPPLVGRHREMDQLKATFEDTLGGHGKMVALVGEPGIGKTRTAQELATYASMRGAQVLWGRCYEGEGAPPYWPWVQAIRSYVMERDAETVQREMGRTASVIAEIVPDVRELLPNIQPPAPMDDYESVRFRLFDSITTFLKTASSAQPIVLILEDLHWSDKPSLMLLEFVARELGNSRMMIVGNYRDMELNRRHPLSLTLGELTREGLFDRVLLRGLQKHDVRRFIEVAAGIDPPSGLVEVVYTQTEGNPLFVTETVRLLIQEGSIASGAGTASGITTWEIQIPEGVREVIGRRLDRLSERCNEVLIVAAVIGRQFRSSVLLNLVDGVSENMLLDVLDEALEASLIEELPGEVGRFQFTHALIQETLTGELSGARRARLHARIGEVLSELYGAEADAHAAELVPHFAEAESLIGSDELIHYLIVAGERALEAAASEVAVEHFERAEIARGDREVDAEGGRILWGLGRARSATAIGGQTQLAWDTLARAFDYYDGAGDAVSAVRIATEQVEFADVTGAAEILDRALSLAPPDSVDARLIMMRLGTAVWFQHGDEERYELLMARALELAREFGDSALEMRTLAVQANIAGLRNRYSECIELAQQVIELAASVSEPIAEGLVSWQYGVAQMHLGDPEHATEQLALGSRAAERLRRLGRSYAPGFYSHFGQSLALFLGDWDRVRETSKTDLERGLGRFFGIVADTQTGRCTADERLGEFLTRDQVPAHEGLVRMFSAAMIASIEPNYVRRAEVVAVVRTWHGLMAQRETTHSVRARGRALVAAAIGLLAGDFGRDEMVDSAHRELMRLQHTALELVSVDRMLGRLALKLGQADGALAHFEDGLEFCRKAGYRPELAWTSYDYAEALLQRDDHGDRSRAQNLSDQALAISTELGMRPLIEKAIAVKEQLERKDDHLIGPGRPAGLTVREMEVLRLIAQGKTTREIADEMVISPRTVQRHTTNLYIKIGARNRAEATAFVLNEPALPD